MARIPILPGLAIEEWEIEEQFVRASGPGGQNVNKVATGVELRFDVARSPSLAAPVKARLSTLAGRRMSKAGILTLSASRFRTQERNRADARARLLALIAAAARPPRPRVETKVPRREKAARRRAKAHRSALKAARQGSGED